MKHPPNERMSKERVSRGFRNVLAVLRDLTAEEQDRVIAAVRGVYDFADEQWGPPKREPT